MTVKWPPETWEKYELSHAYSHYKTRWISDILHQLVCRWLEEHPEDAARWTQPGYMYYDILEKAEQVYLNIPSYVERYLGL